MAILSKWCKTGKFEWCDSLNCSFTNKVFVRILLNVNLSLNQTLLTSVLYVRQLGWLSWFGNFSVRCCLPVIQKDSATHMGGLAVYVRERLPCAGDLSLENSVDSLCFQLALLHSVLLLFSLTFCVLWYKPPPPPPPHQKHHTPLSLFHLMHVIARTHGSTHATSLMHVKSSTAIYVYDTYCLRHRNKKMKERTKTSNFIADHFLNLC